MFGCVVRELGCFPIKFCWGVSCKLSFSGWLSVWFGLVWFVSSVRGNLMRQLPVLLFLKGETIIRVLFNRINGGTWD